MTPVLKFDVLGAPRPQGSLSLKGVTADGRPQLANSPAVVAWRADLFVQIRAQLPEGWVVLEGPLAASFEFYMPRPQNLPKRRPPLWCPGRTNDLSKLVRAVEDAMTAAGVWADDGMAVVESASKRYAWDRLPGVAVELWQLEVDEVWP